MKKTKTQTNKNKKTQFKKIIVAAPSATSRVSRNVQPLIVRRSKDEITVTHREYIRELRSTTNVDFTQLVNTIQGNPGLQLSFPWLSTVATSYESYRFERLKFIFETSTATTATGAFIMAFDYDASDNPPATRLDFMNYEGAVKGPIWSASLEMPLDVKRLNKLGPSRYVRGGVRPNTDIKTYDCGNLYYALINQDVSSISYGDLFVEYTVVLQTPQINTQEQVSDNCAQCVCTPTGNATCFNGAAVTGGLPITCSGASITFPTTGRYLVSALLSNASGTSPAIAWTGTGFTVISNPPNWLGSVGNANSAARTQFVDILSPGTTISANNTGYAAANNFTVDIARFITL